METSAIKLNTKDVLKKKAAAMLDEAITITLVIQPQNFIERLKMYLKLMPRVKQYLITGATMRTMIKISDMLLDIDYSPKPPIGEGQLDWAYKGISDNGLLSVKIIAAAIHNKKGDYNPQLIEELLDGIDAVEHQQLAMNIINKLDIFTFMNTITSIRTMNILNPVSLQAEEIIAPEQPLINGEALETLSSILGSATPI